MGICTKIVKTTLVVGVLASGAMVVGTLVLGQDRMKDLAKELQNSVNENVDELIAKESRLRSRIEKLRGEYPTEVAALRSSLREAEEESARVEQDLQVAREVIALADEDIALLDQAIANLRVSGTITFRQRIYQPHEADALKSRAIHHREQYVMRHNELADELEVLATHIAALESELSKLREEQQTFETEYLSIQREIDRIQRNNHLIEVAQRREAHRSQVQERSRDNLNALKNALGRIRTQQDEQLKALQVRPDALDYEARVRVKRHEDAKRQRHSDETMK